MAIRKKKTIAPKFDPGQLSIQLRENALKAYPDNVWTQQQLLDSVYGIPLEGNIPLQYALGVDVLALGRCMSLVGSWGSSKSSLGWYIAKVFLEHGGLVVSIDTEPKQNPDQIRAIVDNDELLPDLMRHVFTRREESAPETLIRKRVKKIFYQTIVVYSDRPKQQLQAVAALAVLFEVFGILPRLTGKVSLIVVDE